MGKKKKQELNKQKRKMKMQMAEERDYMQEWKERGRLKPFTEEGVEETQYNAKYMNHTNEVPKPSVWERFIAAIKKLKAKVMKWM